LVLINLSISKDYSGEEIGSSSPNSARPPNALGQKPNQLSSPELLPPYSPDLAGRSSNDGSSEYGSVRNSIDPDEEQRVGLLNQQEEPSSSFPEQSRDRDRDSGWKYANPRTVSYLFRMHTYTILMYCINRAGLSGL
jgi:hypothetical protein